MTPEYVAFCTCDNCQAPNIAITTEEPRQLTSPNFMNEPRFLDFRWLPDMPHGKKYDNVPDIISSAANEAYLCFSISSFRACILMARSTIEAICKDKGITDGNLYQKIGNLAIQTGMSPTVKAEADAIRFFGNEMAHGDFSQNVSMDDATDVLMFMDVIIGFVYQQPAKLASIQQRRKERNA